MKVKFIYKEEDKKPTIYSNVIFVDIDNKTRDIRTYRIGKVDNVIIGDVNIDSWRIKEVRVEIPEERYKPK